MPSSRAILRMDGRGGDDFRLTNFFCRFLDGFFFDFFRFRRGLRRGFFGRRLWRRRGERSGSGSRCAVHRQ